MFSWKMELSVRDYTIVKVVQATHYEGDTRYGASRGIQYSCLLSLWAGHCLNLLVCGINLT